MRAIGTSLPLAHNTSRAKMKSTRCRRHTTSLVRINLLDFQEDLDDFEAGLTYKIPTEPKSFEKTRSARCSRHTTSLVRVNLSNLREDLDDSEMGLIYKILEESESLEKMKSVRCSRHELTTDTHYLSRRRKKLDAVGTRSSQVHNATRKR